MYLQDKRLFQCGSQEAGLVKYLSPSLLSFSYTLYVVCRL